MKTLSIINRTGLAAFFLILTFELATAQSIPQRISFQGKLLESGVAVNGNRNFVFSFTNPVGTLWTESHIAVPVVNGLYSVILGETTPIPVTVFSNYTFATLHIVVDGLALSPDLSITSSGFAFKAEKSDDTKKIAGYSVSTTAPTLNYVLKYNGTQWAPSLENWQLSSNNLLNTNSGAILVGTTVRTGKITVVDTSTTIFARSNGSLAGRHAIYGYNENVVNGTSPAINASVNGVVGYTYLGYPYHFGVAGYRYDDVYGPSAGVYGQVSSSATPAAWGALGFQDASQNEYGGYFHGNVFTDGQLKMTGGSPGAGKLLTSDANGLASWVAPGSYSQWTTNGSNIYYNTGNVGIGINPPTSPLHVVSSQIGGSTSVIYGENTYTGTNGYVYGIQGRVNSTSISSAPGVGVVGYSTATTGGGVGVEGYTSGETGRGVWAVSGSTLGINYGVYAQNASTSGRAGYFAATAATGITYGISSYDYSPSGVAGYFYASDNTGTGINYGIYAATTSSNGYAGYFSGGKNYFQGKVGIGDTSPGSPLTVSASQSTTGSSIAYVENTYSGATGWIYGIQGKVFGTSANTEPNIGVLGISSASTGGGAGVMGQSNGATGVGVRAITTAATGVNYSVYAVNSSSDGYAGYFSGGKNYFQGNVGIGDLSPDSPLDVTASQSTSSSSIAYVENTYTGATGWIYGIQGRVNGTAPNTSPSIGVIGISNSSTGGSTGVMGQSNGATGIGVRAVAMGTGVNYAVYAITDSDLGWSGYFAGGKNYFQGNVGIGQSSPTAQLHVQNSGSEKTLYTTGTGNSLTYPTLMSENTGTSGVAAYLKTYGTDATLVLGQDGAATGPLFKGFGANGGNEEIRINTDGNTYYYASSPSYYNSVRLGATDGTLKLYNSDGTMTVQLDASESGTDDGSQITLYNAAGTAVIAMDANYNGTTKGRVTTSELEITGGADIAEPFVISQNENLQPGMVLSIDPENPGKLKISNKAYDRCVAGIVSGASDIQPGLILRQKGTITDGQHLVALTGRVYCFVDASENPVKPGDLLTTSDTPGYAMKVMDSHQSQGAIIGKAMTALENGKGLVLVLVSLQ